MRLVVTRPLRDAERWVDLLAAHGVQAVALPLIAIAPALDRQALRQAWAGLEADAAAMFVSANAVEHFFAAREGAAFTVRAWATGPGTREALLACGVPQGQVDAPPPEAPQFDSEALWRLVRAQVGPGARVLVVRGSDAQGRSAGRDWLSQQVEAAGGTAHAVLAYRRELPVWNQPEHALAAQALREGQPWLFSSSEAVANLGRLLPGQDWHSARAIATHPRIAQAAREAGFGVVCTSRPGLPEVVASIESMR